MSERQGMQSESWRPQRRDSSFDPQITRMAVLAGGVVGVLALGYGAYSLIGHGPRTVPVIEADSRPVRVKPDNPGGMQVAGAEEQIMGGAGSGQADAMAPSPEIPEPQVLRAQIQAARQPAPAAPAAQAALPPAQPVSLSNPPAPPPPVIAAMPEQRPTVVAKPAVVARTPATSPAGHTAVQLAAMETEAAAMTEWQRLTKRMPELMASHHPAVERAERDGKPIFRLRTGGFTDMADATAFCTQVRSKGGGCTIASF
jgi:hypothetical protein